MDVFMSTWAAPNPRDPPGRAGLAHLFEHLILEGSAHLPDRGGYYGAFADIGGTNVNAWTNLDRTEYHAVPSHELDAGLWIMSDTLGFFLPVFTGKQGQARLDNQIQVVHNERREAFETRAYGNAQLQVFKTLFPAGHGYHQMVIGDQEELAQTTLEEARAFFAQHYVMSNMTLVLAGDVTPVRAAKPSLDFWRLAQTTITPAYAGSTSCPETDHSAHRARSFGHSPSAPAGVARAWLFSGGSGRARLGGGLARGLG